MAQDNCGNSSAEYVLLKVILLVYDLGVKAPHLQEQTRFMRLLALDIPLRKSGLLAHAVRRVLHLDLPNVAHLCGVKAVPVMAQVADGNDIGFSIEHSVDFLHEIGVESCTSRVPGDDNDLQRWRSLHSCKAQALGQPWAHMYVLCY